ncbi:phosphate/phosphite/phosphonate ABC transporter substrate-binding protein [Saccharothrix xinjiangensis]|uniref:Phosphate/phosphite/phosphonate ABC transporter substrate-binding protein n=1 Tax=Saccharothrix xinjiangensis TaxID=204798 RepID=A0ABV9YD82_9PSEU
MGRRRTAVASAVLVLLASACGTAPPPEPAAGPLVFSANPVGNSITLHQAFRTTVDMLREETGREIRMQDATSYDSLIEGVRTGEVDFAAFGPLSYVMAKERGAPITAVAAQVKEKGERAGFRAYGVTRPGSGVTSLADVRGRAVCYVDEASTSGYLYPSAELIRLGINPDTDVRQVFAGSHEAAVLAVVNGRCDVGFAFDAMVDRHLVERGQIGAGDVTRIWESGIIPGAPIAVSDDLPDEVRDDLVAALRDKANSDYLRDHGFCQGECPLGDADAYGYAPVEDSFYDEVREVCRITRHRTCRGG